MDINTFINRLKEVMPEYIIRINKEGTKVEVQRKEQDYFLFQERNRRAYIACISCEEIEKLEHDISDDYMEEVKTSVIVTLCQLEFDISIRKEKGEVRHIKERI